MRQYLSVVRIRFIYSLQYRAAALAGIATQFAWGFLLLMLYRAFYNTNAAAFPTTFQQLANYIWMQQAFLHMFSLWYTDNDIFDLIERGDVAYELTRPAELYWIWFGRNIGRRAASSLMRCIPVLGVAFLLPAPYGLLLPRWDWSTWAFIISLALSLHMIAAFNMFAYLLTLKSLSAGGVRVLMYSMTELLTGALVPLPFFPDWARRAIELTPFGAMQNVTLRIYSGEITGASINNWLLTQAFWLVVLVAVGWLLIRRALAKAVLQGG